MTDTRKALADWLNKHIQYRQDDPVKYGVDATVMLQKCEAALRTPRPVAKTGEPLKLRKYVGITEDQIKYMAERFLRWKLPEHFHPDHGISFDEKYRSDHGPVGTNLFSAVQAEVMVWYMIQGLEVKQAFEASPAAPGGAVGTAIPSPEREAFRAGWWINACPAEDEDGEAPRSYLEECEEVDWQEYVKALPGPSPSQSDGFMARLSASEVACYQWPEDTDEHKALRKAFMDGAARAAQPTPPDSNLQKVQIGPEPARAEEPKS